MTKHRAECVMSAGLHLNRFLWTYTAIFPVHNCWYDCLTAGEIRAAADRFTAPDELLPELAQGV